MPQLAQKHGKRTNKSPKELYLLLKIFKKQIQTTASETVSVLNFFKKLDTNDKSKNLYPFLKFFTNRIQTTVKAVPGGVCLFI